MCSMPCGAERGPAASLPRGFAFTGQRGPCFGLVHREGTLYYSAIFNGVKYDWGSPYLPPRGR